MKTKTLLATALFTALPALVLSITSATIAGGVLASWKDNLIELKKQSREIEVIRQKADLTEQNIAGIYNQTGAIADDMRRLPATDVSHDHSEVRELMIRYQLSQVERPIVVLGDSNTEATVLPSSICGFPVVNAGIGGATVNQFVLSAKSLLRGVSPSAIVISLGTNNAQKAASSPNKFSFLYTALWGIAGRYSKVVIAANIPDIRPGGAANFDPSRVQQFNKEIAAIGRSSVIDLNGPLSINDLTVDGVHFNGDGYRIISSTLTAGIAKILCPMTATQLP